MTSDPSNHQTVPTETKSPQAASPGLQRRTLLTGAAGAAALLTVAGAAPAAPTGKTNPRAVNPQIRRNEALKVRIDATKAQAKVRPPQHPTNGDDLRYPTKFASFTKGLPHRDNGEVDLRAYAALVKAVSTGNPADFERIPLGGTRKLVNPQSGFAFTLEGIDPWSLATPPAYAFASEDQAAEAAEVYWMALTRDIPFAQYGREPITQAAIADLNRFARYRGVDAKSLFRVHSPASPGMLAARTCRSSSRSTA